MKNPCQPQLPYNVFNDSSDVCWMKLKNQKCKLKSTTVALGRQRNEGNIVVMWQGKTALVCLIFQLYIVTCLLYLLFAIFNVIILKEMSDICIVFKNLSTLAVVPYFILQIQNITHSCKNQPNSKKGFSSCVYQIFEFTELIIRCWELYSISWTADERDIVVKL